MPAKSSLSLAERLAARSEPDLNTGCHLWTGCGLASGYGSIKVGRKMQLTHRVAYEVHRGPIPAGMLICHACDTPACINPAHLFVGSDADNTADKVAKGRAKGWDSAGERNPAAKLSATDVLDIRAALSQGSRRGAALGRQYGVSQRMISAIKLGKAWGSV